MGSSLDEHVASPTNRTHSLMSRTSQGGIVEARLVRSTTAREEIWHEMPCPVMSRPCFQIDRRNHGRRQTRRHLRAILDSLGSQAQTTVRSNCSQLERIDNEDTRTSTSSNFTSARTENIRRQQIPENQKEDLSVSRGECCRAPASEQGKHNQ